MCVVIVCTSSCVVSGIEDDDEDDHKGFFLDSFSDSIGVSPFSLFSSTVTFSIRFNCHCCRWFGLV